MYPVACDSRTKRLRGHTHSHTHAHAHTHTRPTLKLDVYTLAHAP